MQDERWQRIQLLFEQVVALPANERGGFLEAECGGDIELRSSVESLLQADSGESLIIGQIDVDDALNFDRGLEGSEIGAYRLMQRIGAGGMGSVFLAERSDGAFERKVAVKIVKKGMDTESVIRRFETERTILARLDHPNIATLLDGGVTGDGRPYFVMEHVDGIPITTYCDRHRLGVTRRLELFRQVCAAVHYAHQGLVVHRDLKPSNILVTDSGEVKLLDFGIAKLLDDDSDDLTRTGMAVLTPAYAAPEQLMAGPVTTGTDVYALGVILYELLCGRRPFEVWKTSAELRAQALADDPPKPSAALTRVPVDDAALKTLTADDVSAVRSVVTSRLQQLLRGDLDTICLMAIRRQPSDRYSSAEQFATDIDRHLAGLPVIARPDSVAYRISKFARRYRVEVTVAAAALITIVGLVSYYTARVAAERDAAVAEQRKTTEVVEFVTGLFESSNPYQARGDTITAREMLDEGSARLRTELASNAELRATMLRVLGEVYYSLDVLDKAEPLLDEALDVQRGISGESSLDVATTRLALGRIYQYRGDYPQAEEQFKAGIATRRALLGDDNPEVMIGLSALAFLEETRGEFDTAEQRHGEVLQMARRLYPGDDVVVAEALSSMAGLYRMQDRARDAEPMLRDAIAMLDRMFEGDHPLKAKITRQLAGLLRNTGRLDEAEPYYEEIIDAQTRMLGPDHHELATTWNGYSQLMADMGRTEEAIEANRQLFSIAERASGGEPHPTFGAAYNNFAFILRDAGRLDEALENFEKSLAALDAIDLPERHPNRSFPTAGIASVYYRQGQFDLALGIYRDMLELRSEAFGEEHRLTSEVKSDLAATLAALGEYEEAEALLLDAYRRFMEDRGRDDTRTQRAARRLIEVYEDSGRPDDAAEYREVYDSDH